MTARSSLPSRLRAVLLPLLALAVLVQGLLAPVPAEAQPAQPVSFVEACADKSEERGRLRYCDAYFREGLGPQADTVLYLRDRITTLRASQEVNAESNYESFLTAVAIVAFLSIATMVLVTSERRISGIAKWSSVASAAAVLVMVAILTLGWLDKYRAEDAAMLELGLLRDQVEVEASHAIASGRKLDEATIRRWTDRLHEIGIRFASNYGAASIVPDLDRFTPQN
ncbi:phenylalanyl-tRNA synthetase subunit alpha [Stappia indica]|uniref:Phenylalanyl-tRNA synthetase subunit alpha n=1 Tax=Stappia indica TaxID=538381 RepID=A0A857CAV2_9HYPH|nr:phenylalanyl-tRNA synthetase subunit alpha [Stappia indica]QGZ35967.1 phenylalanyl-tRNA synthetase subunit alpha [Stappia indica]